MSRHLEFMAVAIEIFLLTVIAGVFALSFSKLAIGDWWYPELSWKVVGVVFVIFTIGLNFLYFVIVK